VTFDFCAIRMLLLTNTDGCHSQSKAFQVKLMHKFEMHTVQNYKLSKTKQVYLCGKQGRIRMLLIILKWKNLF